MEKNIYKAPALNISPKHTIQTIGSTMHTELRKPWNPATYINKFLTVIYKDSLTMINQCNMTGLCFSSWQAAAWTAEDTANMHAYVQESSCICKTCEAKELWQNLTRLAKY